MPTVDNPETPINKISKAINKLLYDAPNLVKVNGFWVPPIFYNIKSGLWSIDD